MLLYLAATNRVISIVIVVERQEEGHEYGVQRPVYYVSEVLTESKQRYPHFQKLAYGIFRGSWKLRHYFLEHPMTVVSTVPLASIMNNSDATVGTPTPEPEPWIMHFDGSKRHQGSGAGVTLKSPTGEELKYVL